LSGCFFCDVGFCIQFKEDLSGCHLADFMDFVYQAGYTPAGIRRKISNANLSSMTQFVVYWLMGTIG